MNESIEQTIGRGAQRHGVRERTPPSRPPILVRRPGLRFHADRARRWLHGSAATLVVHAFSPMFPAGERFFIKAVMSRPGFHPWEQDDRDLLEQWRQAYPDVACQHVNMEDRSTVRMGES